MTAESRAWMGLEVVGRKVPERVRGMFGIGVARMLFRRMRLLDENAIMQLLVIGEKRWFFIYVNDCSLSQQYTWNLPSTPWYLLLGGVYMSLQFGQYNFTVSSPGRSERPHGATGHD